MKFPADLVTFTEEILNGKLHFLYSDKSNFPSISDICPFLVSLFIIDHGNTKIMYDAYSKMTMRHQSDVNDITH